MFSPHFTRGWLFVHLDCVPRSKCFAAATCGAPSFTAFFVTRHNHITDSLQRSYSHRPHQLHHTPYSDRCHFLRSICPDSSLLDCSTRTGITSGKFRSNSFFVSVTNARREMRHFGFVLRHLKFNFGCKFSRIVHWNAAADCLMVW